MKTLKPKKIELPEQAKISKEQLKAEREDKKDLETHRIECMQREMLYKQNQIERGITETRVLETAPGQPTVAVDAYKDGVKPKYVIENEIAALTLNIKRSQKQLEEIEKLENEDTKS